MERSERSGEQPAAGWRYDPATDLMLVSAELARLLGLKPDASGGISMGRLCDAYGHPGGEKLEIAMRLAVKNRTAFDIVAPLGAPEADSPAVVRIVGEAWSDQAETGIRGEVHDVTTQQQQTRERWRAGSFDPATRLPNRFLFEDRLQMALAQAERDKSGLAAVMLSVSEKHGTPGTIDGVMASITALLQTVLRANDTIARVASGTFALVLPGATEIDRVVAPLERVRNEADPGGKGQSARLSMACGVAMYPRAGNTAADLSAAADRALVRAMRGGLESAAPFAWNLGTR